VVGSSPGFFVSIREVDIEDEQPLNRTEPESEPESPRTNAAPRPRKKPLNWKRVGSNVFILLFAAAVIVLVWSFVYRTFIEPPVQPETVQGGKAHTIQLDVLNGSGVPKLSQRFTDYLRARGFDVVEMGNYKESGVDYTRVIDRTGQSVAAQQVAEALGVPKERVVQQIDRNLYLDVSVVIGKDYKSLKPLK
jgi:hypothetical protein